MRELLVSRLKSLKNPISRDILSLYGVQIANYVIPFLLIPYYSRALGLYNYGIIAIFQSVTAISFVFSDYGFQYTAVRRLTVIEKTKEHAPLVWSILVSRLLLSVVGCILCVIALVYIKAYPKSLELLFPAIALSIGNFFNVQWYYLGVGKIARFSSLTLVGRVFYLVLTLLFVKSNDDLSSALWIIALPTIAINAILAFKILKGMPFDRTFVSPNKIWSEINGGSHIFISNLASAALTNIGTVFVGAFHGSLAAGSYSVVERIAKSVGGLFQPINQVIYPRVAMKFSKNYNLGVSYVFRIALIVMPIMMLATLGVFSIIGILSQSMFNVETNQFIRLSLFFVPWVMFGVINNFIGIQLLVARGYDKYYVNSFITGIAFYIASLATIGISFGVVGAAASLLFGEFVVFLCIVWSHQKIRNRISEQGA